MRPAWSIIFFTTMSGLGLGLAGWIVIGLLPLMTQQAVIGVGVVTLALIGAGLISSTFHLGHPERAWRALSYRKRNSNPFKETSKRAELFCTYGDA